MPRERPDNAEDWEKLRNDIEVIKNRVKSLDRIAVMQNHELLVQDIQRVIGESIYKAAILHITSERMGAEQLAKAIGTHPSNLSKFTKGLTDSGYLNEFKNGTRKEFERDEKLGMIRFETMKEFAPLLEKWRSQRSDVGE